MQRMTDLVASIDHDVGSAEEAGDGGRMCVKKPLLRLRNTITTPVYLHELR